MAENEKTDNKGRPITPVVTNESEDGTGTWHILVVDANGYVKVVAA